VATFFKNDVGDVQVAGKSCFLHYGLTPQTVYAECRFHSKHLSYLILSSSAAMSLVPRSEFNSHRRDFD
jgi:hypothetical protein